MTMHEARKLKSGDRVWWHDPDGGIADAFLTIATVRIAGDHLAIEDTEGGELECFPRELSLVTGLLVTK